MLSGTLDMIAKLYCVRRKSHKQGLWRPDEKRVRNTHRKQYSLYLSTVKSRRSQQQQVAIPGKQARINVRFPSLGDHKRVVQIHV